MLKHKSSMVHISTLCNQPWMPARSHSSKSTLLQHQSFNENTSAPQVTETHSLPPLFTLPPTRTRKSSTSSVKTIKSYGELPADKKKRPRESMDGGRRTRQRTASTASTDTVADVSQPSCVPFPSSVPASEHLTKSQHSPSLPSSSSSSPPPPPPPKRQFSPPKLIPTRAAPSVPVITKGAPVQNPKPMAPLNEPARFEPFPDLLSSPRNRSWFDHLDFSASYMSEADYDLSISFYKRQPHFDVWDLDDDVYIGIPARIHMVDAPDVRFLDIICQSYEHPYPYPYYLQSEPEYTVSFRGYHRTWSSGPETELDLQKGIVVQPRWFNHLPSRTSPIERIVTSSRGVLPPDSDCSSAPVVDGSQDMGRRYIKILIPIPMSLIRAGNARVFRVEVKAGRVPPVEGYGLEEVGGAEAELVVSHLKSECEMGMKGHKP
ncbi:hypothetical protein L218DRAFT_1081785 [Marasmius fiardii PR-910]|nr:hypothetical protein L218DRAFT_1081785 [Marasmius fiardii PR-910]